DPGYPRERLAFMLKDAQAPVLVTQSALLGELPLAGGRLAHTVCLDTDRAAIARRPARAPPIRIHPHSPASVPRPPGSPGTPTGVVIAHGSLANKALELREKFNVTRRFRAACFISSSFDASIEQIIMPLVGGGAVVVLSNETRETPPRFWQEVTRH